MLACAKTNKKPKHSDKQVKAIKAENDEQLSASSLNPTKSFLCVFSMKDMFLLRNVYGWPYREVSLVSTQSGIVLLLLLLLLNTFWVFPAKISHESRRWPRFEGKEVWTIWKKQNKTWFLFTNIRSCVLLNSCKIVRTLFSQTHFF